MADYPNTRPNQNEGDPIQVKCVYAATVARYTDTGQLPYFRQRINWFWGQDCNVRIDPDDPDGKRIRWFWDYYLPWYGFLYEPLVGTMQGITEDQLREYLSPTGDWPEDLSTMFPPWPYVEPAPEPAPAPEPPPETEPEVPGAEEPSGATETGTP